MSASSAGPTSLPGTSGPPETGPNGSGKAGRNVPIAIAVGSALGAAVVVTLYTYRPLFVALVAVSVAYGCYELASVMRSAADRAIPGRSARKGRPLIRVQSPLGACACLTNISTRFVSSPRIARARGV